MIKYINPQEINKLREKFSTIITYKKISNRLEPYLKGAMCFEEAIDIFLQIISLKNFIEIENAIEVFSSYLEKSNLLEDDILKMYFDISFDFSKDYYDEELEEKEEYVYSYGDIHNEIENIIKYISKSVNIELKIEDFSNIIFNFDQVDNDFKELHELNKDIFDEYKNSEDFEEVINDYSIIYLFKNLKLSEKQIYTFNSNSPFNSFGGFRTEFFTIGNNTYLSLSMSFCIDIIDRGLLAILICLILKGGKYK